MRRDELAVFGRGRLWLALVAAPLNARVFQLAGAAPTLASAANTAAFNVGNTLGPVAGGIAITAGYGYAAPSWIALALIARVDPARRGGVVEGFVLMRTLLGWGRWAQRRLGRGPGRRGGGSAAVRPLAGGRAPLIVDRLGLQTRGGAKLDQVDGTTCGSAVLVALAAWADPTETRRSTGRAPRSAAVGSPGMAVGFGGRYDARQRQVHKESTKFWPQALGTSPWGMVAWLRRHAPGAGPYRRAAGRRPQRPPTSPPPSRRRTPRWRWGGRCRCWSGRSCRATTASRCPATGDAWHVYEPTSGEVRAVPLDHVRRSTLARSARFRPAVRRAPAVLKMLSVAPRKLDG